MIQNIAEYIDHTNLKQDATKADIQKLCQDAIDYNFYSVCINPCYVNVARQILQSRDKRICSVIGFPLGANRTVSKLQEAMLAIQDGAHELDMVANIGWIKEHLYKRVESAISEIRKNIPYNIILKVIVESSQLSDIEIIEMTKVVIHSAADYIKTSTGFFGGATVETVALMAKTANGKIKVKASSGIKTLSDCEKMISAGASRLGTSHSLAILEEFQKKNN